MEPDASPPSPPTTAVDLRALTRLRERVEAAAREVERLRTENAALAERLANLQEEAPPPGLALPGEEAPEVLRARVEGFIQTIDRLLAGELPADSADSAAFDTDPESDADPDPDTP